MKKFSVNSLLSIVAVIEGKGNIDLLTIFEGMLK